MKKRALFNSIIALILCVAMLAGSTFAWFTDSSVSTGNIIQSGNLDIEMYWAEDLNSGWNNVEDNEKNRIFDYEYWEPGYTQVRYIRIVNAGNLAFRYALEITPNGEESTKFNFSVNGTPIAGDTDGKAVAYTPVSLSLNENDNGATQTVWYARTTDDANNTYRNVILQMQTAISYNIGSLTYKLTNAVFA